MPETAGSNTLLKRFLALVVLVIAAYVLFKLIIGTLVAIFYGLAIVAAVVAVFWAYSTIKRR